MCPPPWSAKLWAIERMSVNLSAHAGVQRQEFADVDARHVGADRPKSPRYSSGASGFMSYVSMCGGPPGSQRRMTEVLSEGDDSRRLCWMRNSSGIVNARMRNGSPRKCRRIMGPGQFKNRFIQKTPATRRDWAKGRKGVMYLISVAVGDWASGISR